MSKVSDNLLGLTLDSGSAMLVRESAVAETGNAALSNVLLETFKFAGVAARHEYLMPQMTEMHWAMRAFENRIPDCELLISRARETDQPNVAIACYDELIRLAFGSSGVPAMRVIPGNGILANAYKTAEGIVDGLYGRYSYPGYTHAERGVLPQIAPIAPQNLTSLALGINFGAGIPWMLPEQLDAMNSLITIWKAWRAMNVDPEDMSVNDLNALYRAFGVYGLEPDWYTAAGVTIDPIDGSIMIDGVRYENANQIRPYFPDITLNYRGTTRTLAEWAASHNRAIRNGETPIPVGQVQRVRANALPALGLTGQITVRDGARTRTITLPDDWDTTPLDGILFSCTAGGITEYIYMNLANMRNNAAYGGLVNTNALIQRGRRVAAQIWSDHHAGRARGEGVFEVARRILAIRDNEARRDALVPTVAATLNALADELDPVNNADVQAIVNMIRGAPMASAAGITTLVDMLTDPLNRIRPVLPKQMNDLLSATGVGALGAAVSENGLSFISAGRYEPTANEITALVPVLGRGVVPMTMRRVGATLTLDQVRQVAVVLEEPPITVYSPVKTMIATSLLINLIERLNGEGPNFGVPTDPFDDANPFGVGQTRPCARTTLNRQLQRYAEALVTAIENATVEQMPDLLRAVERLSDARYFLDYVDEVVNSIILRDDWVYMLQSLLVSIIASHPESIITNSDGTQLRTITAGTVPPRSVQFIFDNVLADIVDTPAYQQALALAQPNVVTGNPRLTEIAAMQRVVRGEVLLERVRNGLDLLQELVDGTNSLITNVHVTSIVELQDLSRTADLVAAIRTAADRDYLGLVNRAEFEAPWEVAEWATQFAAFAFSVEDEPIEYNAVDKAAEIAADSGMSAVAAALGRAGFSWSEIAPASMRVRGVDQDAVVIMDNTVAASRGGRLFNNAPVSHQTLKITTVAPSYDIEAYGLVKAYLTMNTSRTYFPQPVGRDISDVLTLRLNIAAESPLLTSVMGAARIGAFRARLEDAQGWQIEKCPALRNVAMILPYVSSYITKAVITRDVAVPQLIEIDSGKSLAVFSGVIMTPMENDPRLLGWTNGLAITAVDRHTISTALPWIGA